jgi:hypothetical protein
MSRHRFASRILPANLDRFQQTNAWPSAASMRSMARFQSGPRGVVAAPVQLLVDVDQLDALALADSLDGLPLELRR